MGERMDWSKADSNMVERIVEEGEAYLAGQLKLATSADQRASMLAGVFTAGATAVIAGLLTLHTAEKIALAQKFPVYLGGGVGFLLFLAAASFCIAAIFPVGFWLPGNEPQAWYRDIEGAKDLKLALGEEAEHIQSKISENREVLSKNATRFKIGAILGIAAPIVALAVWMISSSSGWVLG